MAKAKSKPKRVAKRRKPPAVLDRVTRPDKDTGRSGVGWEEARQEFFLWQMGALSEYKEQVHVNSYTAQTYSVVWRCLAYISQTIAGLGWHQFEGVPGKPGKDRVYDDISWLLDTQASPEMSAFEWRQVMVRTAAKDGNSYSEIDKDGFGRPKWLYYLSPERIELKRDGDGVLYYRVDNGVGNEPTILPPDRMFHLRAPGPDGLIGYSMIALARATIRLGLQMEKYGDTFFGRGPMPGGILELPAHTPKTERDEMRTNFEKTYGGSKNAGRVVVVSGGIKFNPLSLPNDDAQFIESRKFEVNEICRWFGVPPHKVFDLERATFSNIEHQSIEAVQDCHLPWCRRLESEADIKLFGRVNRGRRWTRLNLNTLLRGDSATQTDNLVKQVTSGITKLDEAREHLDMNPLQDDLGDTPLIQGAMAPLDRIINPPEPVAPAPPPANPAQDGGDPAQPDGPPPQKTAAAAQLQDVFAQLLADAYGRLLRVETDKAKRAESNGVLNRHIDGFYTAEGHQRHVAETIRPVLVAALLACDRPVDAADRLAADFAEYHIARSTEDLHSGIWQKEWTNGRAHTQARAHLRQLWKTLK